MRALTAYYLATPLFALVDVGFGAPIRVAGLEAAGARWGYYAGLLVLAGVCHRWPPAAPWVGMGESVVNLTLLLLGVLLPVWDMPEAFLAGAAVEEPFDRSSVVNVLLSGSALIVSFHRNQAEALSHGADA